MKRTGIFLLALGCVSLLLAISWHSITATPSAVLPWQPILPDHPTRAWVSANFLLDRTLFVTTDGTLQKTADEGDTWEVLYPRPPLTETLGIVAFAADTGNQTLFLARNVPAGPAEVYRSPDGGLTWGTVFSTTEAVLQDITAVRNQEGQLVVFAIGGSRVWRSENGGDDWETAETGLPEFADLYHIYPSPDFANDHTLYLTGFGPLIRSTTGGDEWSVVTIPDVDIPRHLVFSPHYATDHTLWLSYFFVEGSGESAPNGVARSTNSGQSWEIVSEGLPVDYLDGWIMGLAVSPDSRLYAIERALFANGTRWEFFHSANNGNLWQGQGVAPDATPTGLLSPIRGLFFLPTQSGLWRLRSTCAEWLVNGDMELNAGWAMPATPATAEYDLTQAHTGNRSIRIGIVSGNNQLAYSSAYQDVTIPADAITATLTVWLYPVATHTGDNDAQYIYVMDEEFTILETLLHTLSNNQAWGEHTFDLSDYRGQTIRLYVGVYNNGSSGTTGLYLDTASLVACEPPGPGPLTEHIYLPVVMKQWQASPPEDPPAGPLLIEGEPVTQLIGHPKSETIYALTDGGLYRSDNGAQTWGLVNATPPVTRSILLAASQPDLLYGGPGYPCLAGGDPVAMWQSIDGGQNWTELPDGLNLQPLAIHPSDPGRAYARGCDGPYVTTNGGDTWELQPDELFLIYEARLVAPATADNWQTVYIGGISEGGGGAIIGSQNGGNDWEQLTPLPQAPWAITALAVDPISSTQVYFGEANAFWGSDDGGTTWYTSTHGLEDVVYDPGGPITQTYGLLSLAYDSTNLDHWLLGTVRGIYETVDRGHTWTKLTNILWQEKQINALLLREAEPNKLFLTTPEGVYVYYFGG